MSKRAIFKFPLIGGMRTVVHAPFCATSVTHAAEQNGSICVWTEVNREPGASQETRTFLVRATGQEYEATGKPTEYIGTVHIPPFVWHVFEEYEGGGKLR